MEERSLVIRRLSTGSVLIYSRVRPLRLRFIEDSVAGSGA